MGSADTLYLYCPNTVSTRHMSLCKFELQLHKIKKRSSSWGWGWVGEGWEWAGTCAGLLWWLAKFCFWISVVTWVIN